MDRLVRMNLWATDDDKCGRCGMTEKKAGCCEDKKIHLKLKLDQQKSLISKCINLFSIASINLPPYTSFTLTDKLKTEIYPGWSKPPLITTTPIHIKNCVFRI